jgi:FixJ family two-component response regulator
VYGYVQTNHKQHAGSQRADIIVIVDDDEQDASRTQKSIVDAYPNVDTRVLQSGEDLLRYLKAEDGFSDRARFPYPSLILLDLTMPGMHGFAVLTWLSTNPPHNHVPVIVLTGSPGEIGLTRSAYKLGARSFLTKPLKSGELHDTVDMLINSDLTKRPQRPT